MMEIAWVIGILAAFILGAYIRAPFPIVKKKQLPEPVPTEEELTALKEKEEAEKEEAEHLQSILGYTHDIARGKKA
ncbi:MAG: hypothetical protein ABFD76_06805 [Smithella sp.]